MGIATMLRIHFLQQCFGLSDPAMEEALHDVPLYREFADLEGPMRRLPDESTILRFRHLLEKQGLAAPMLATVNRVLQAHGLMLKAGTVVDATLISAPSSTKNPSGERDPEMRQMKKGNNWYFGMKAHIGADVDSLKYYLLNLPADNALEELVRCAHMRWCIQRDDQELKRELGLGRYEGRGWCGFHDHSVLSIAAYGFLVGERLRTGKTTSTKKNAVIRQVPTLSAHYIARGTPARTAARAGLDCNDLPPTRLQAHRMPRSVLMLRTSKRSTTLLTQ
jgi:hypothetical protein